MPEYVNLTEAARRLGITDKTLRGWLLAGRFPNAKKLINGNWAIPLAEVEARIAETTEHTDSSAAAMLKVLEHFTQEIEGLRRQVDALTEELHKKQPPPPMDIYSMVRPPRTTGISGNLPPGYVALVAFHHGVPETTVSRWRKADASRASMGDWRDSSGHLVKVALSPDQQAAFYRAFSSHKSFQPCPSCPHISGQI